MHPATPKRHVTTRKQWDLHGQVQGVGFRPFVYRIALANQLTGFVRNDTSGVCVQAQGPVEAVEHFAESLMTQLPPLATIDHVHVADIPVVQRELAFEIRQSDSQHDAPSDAAVTVDSAVCPDCLDELFDDHDPRHRYGLINCTNCGPRYSIIKRVPYDRPNTTMAEFQMCDQCAQQYASPTDRRFHAQPIACNECGPIVTLVSPQGQRVHGDPYLRAARLLQQGLIVAMKGIGGFHLVTRADDADAVARLRFRKKRDAKPFAVMCRSIEAARKLVVFSEEAELAVTSPQRPIVLGKRVDEVKVAFAVAPGMDRLGVMLPYTPMQHLLFDALPKSIDTLVMTSGNVSDEPLVIDNAEAIDRLGPLCDAMLWHDRPIQRCVDDSVMLDLDDGRAVLPIRRARGYVPTALRLPMQSEQPGLCVGGELKNTVAVVRGSDVICSQHLGDLTHAKAFENFNAAIEDLCDLFDIQPAWIAHDMHPLYMSTSGAKRLAAKWGVPMIPVQHHHAHAAAVMAEHGRTEPTLCVICDGVGYGDDGSSWGGELLLTELHQYKRLASLKPLRLPGMDAAARDTRRCALALMYAAFGEEIANHAVSKKLYPDKEERKLLTTMIRRNVNCAASSSVGRIFDAAAALMGICQYNDYEAQAPMLLEALAACHNGRLDTNKHYIILNNQIDLFPILPHLVAPTPATYRAALLHDQIAMAWAEVVTDAVAGTGIRTIALSGGVFCNELLTRMLTYRLETLGLTVLRHQCVPANDGGIAFGQAAVAVATRKVGA